ncbi:hypothetical protein [Clostridium sp. C2-6-12]|uniref:hypothetical protein n=1 Tax=Clostridium sp. C2-6-12 TaxID=2698832 RepID=UPI00136BF21D|nr:hypothetical protein [Clostridium sp. C2-6-12]
MPIYRAEHKQNFTMILNNVLNDQKLSYGARGLMSHVLTHYDNWVFTGEDYFITKVDKKAKIRGYIKELITNGYLKRTREIDSKGRLGNSIYIFYEMPNCDYPNLENRKMEEVNPNLEKPNLEKQKQGECIEVKVVNPNSEKSNLDYPNLDYPNLENRKLNNTNINNINIYSSSDYEEVWKLYPNKKGKVVAFRKIPKLLNQYSKEELMRCIKRYSYEVKDRDKQYILNGSTFFNGRYEDYLDNNYQDAQQNELINENTTTNFDEE